MKHGNALRRLTALALSAAMAASSAFADRALRFPVKGKKAEGENDDQMGKNGSDFHAALPPLGSQIQMQSEMVLEGL